MFTVLLDNGHGVNTAGKRSPKIDFINRQEKLANRERTAIDNLMQFREYLFTRQVTEEVAKRLKEKNYNVIMITPETNDILLSSRVLRINQYCRKFGAGNCAMVSVHVNAAGNGNWMSARGWSAWTTRGQNNSGELADCFYDAAQEIFMNNEDLVKSFIGSKYKPILVQKTDGDRDYESNFAIIKGANCPAVLIKNFFQDNKEDIKYLESKQGFEDIVNVIVSGIEKYAKKYKKI